MPLVAHFGVNIFCYFCSVNSKLTDISGVIFDDDDLNRQPAGILVADSGNFRVYKMLFNGCWRAVKVVGPNIPAELGRAMLEKEFHILSSLGHRALLVPVGLGEIKGVGTALVTGWIEGESLDSYLKSGDHPRKELSSINDELIDVVAYIHNQGVTHRDLKPSNIIIDREGHVRLIDFGLADKADQCLLKNVTGTPGYSAPEIKNPDGRIDWYRADVFSLGVIMGLVKGSFCQRILARRCASYSPRKRPVNGQAVARRLKTMRKWLRVILVATIVLSGLIFTLLLSDDGRKPDNDLTPRASDPEVEKTVMPFDARIDTPVTSTVASTDVVPPVNNSTPVAPGETANKIDRTEKSAAGVDVDVNFLLLRAAAIRDSVRYISHYKDKASDTTCLRNKIAELRQKAVRRGLQGEKLRHFDAQTTSTAFYNGAWPKFYAN